MGYLTPVAALSRIIHCLLIHSGGGPVACFSVWHPRQSQRNEGYILWRCRGAVVVAAMFLATSDSDGMCWPFPCCISLSLALMHLFHSNTLLALTGLQPPLCFLINGLNRPPTMHLKRGWMCWGGETGRSHDFSFRPVLKRALCPSD